MTSFDRVLAGLVELHVLIRDGKGESAAAEAVRDRLDAPLRALGPEDRERARLASEAMYREAERLR